MSITPSAFGPSVTHVSSSPGPGDDGVTTYVDGVLMYRSWPPMNPAETAVARVAELHSLKQWLNPVMATRDGEVIRVCDHCQHRYPCPTIRTIRGEL